MGISGSLKDVSVADVMQFIHLGRRTYQGHRLSIYRHFDRSFQQKSPDGQAEGR